MEPSDVSLIFLIFCICCDFQYVGHDGPHSRSYTILHNLPDISQNYRTPMPGTLRFSRRRMCTTPIGTHFALHILSILFLALFLFELYVLTICICETFTFLSYCGKLHSELHLKLHYYLQFRTWLFFKFIFIKI